MLASSRDVNVWALPKANPLKQLLLNLCERLGPDGFVVLDKGEGPEAVTLCQASYPDISAYLYIYGQSAGQYGLHLEYPSQNGLPLAPDIHEAMTRLQALEALEIHLTPVGAESE